MESRPIFDPVDTSFDPNDVTGRDKDDVESPSLSSSNALARFEFEPGKSREGTKVLMVEWEDDATTKNVRGDWEISWEGKRTVLPARDGGGEVNRLYFLLGPGVSIPTNVKLAKGQGSGSVVWRTNPLPAIFSPELGATATAAGKRGVLHTIWAKKRLQVLQKEIESESKENVEGIGLEMAVAEKEWIENNFGVMARPGNIAVPPASAMASVDFDKGMASPRSPGGSRLMDKLRGLKVGTTDQDLQGSQQQGWHNPLSPETSDVAVGSIGSFAAIKGSASSGAAKQTKSPQRKASTRKTPTSVAAPQRPPSSGMASLDAFARGDTSNSTFESADDKDDLFALPMSPRSAATSSSPFTFGTQDTIRYLKGEKA